MSKTVKCSTMDDIAAGEKQNISTFDLETQYGRLRILMDDNFLWLRPFCEDIQPLLLLKDNWDFHGAQRVTLPAIEKCFAVMESLMRKGTPSPHVSAHPWGGLQLEWQSERLLLQVTVSDVGSLSAYGKDMSTNQDWEIEKIADRKRIRDELQSLTAACAA